MGFCVASTMKGRGNEYVSCSTVTWLQPLLQAALTESWSRAVYLVGEDHVGEDRPDLNSKVLVCWLKTSRPTMSMAACRSELDG